MAAELRNPGTLADDAAVGTLAWSNPGNAGASDNSNAQANSGLGGGITHYLKATNFGFTVPAGATIDGIEVEVERRESGTVADEHVKIVKGGTVGATNKATATEWPTTDAYVLYGTPTDLWGEAWTAADINASTFGVVVAADLAASTSALIDHIRITVHYTETGVAKSASDSFSLTAETGSVDGNTSKAGSDSGALTESGVVQIGISASDSAGMSEGVAWKERQGAQKAAEPARVFVEMEFTQDPPKYAWREVVRADNPTRFFPMNESSGSTAEDDAGTPSDGTYVGTPTFGLLSPIAGDPLEKAVSFAPSSYLQATAAAAPEKLTVGGWIHNTTRPGADADILVNTGAGKIFLDSAGVIKANFGQALVGPTIPLNTDAHVAVEVDTSVTPNVHRLVVDGEVEDEVTGAATLSLMTSTYRFGSPGSTQFQGRVKGLTIWDDTILPLLRLQQQVIGAPVAPKPETSESGLAERWQDVTRLVRSFSIRRGRRDVLDRAEAGTLEMQMDNTDRRFEAEYAGELVNRCKNPSLEESAADWAPIGSGVTAQKTTGLSTAGKASLRVHNVHGGAGRGAKYEPAGRLPIRAERCTVSARWTTGSFSTGKQVRIRLHEYDAGGGLIRSTDAPIVELPSWPDYPRVSHEFALDLRTESVVPEFVTANDWGALETFFLDAIQIESGSLTDYVDGDQEGCRWESTAHASGSVRGGPYYPNLLPMRRIRVVASHGANLLRDSSFETEPLGTASNELLPWVATSGAGITVGKVAGGVHGGFAVRGQRDVGVLNNTTSVGGSSGSGRPGMIRVTPSEPYIASAYLMKSAATNPKSRIIVWFYANETSSADGYSGVATNIDPPQGSWQRYDTGPLIAPEWARYARIEIWLVDPFVDNAFAYDAYCDAIQLEQTSLSPFNEGLTATLFTGHVERWPQQSPSYRRGFVSITAVDGFEPLRQAEIRGDLEQAVSGTRINRLLDYIGYPNDAGKRNIDAGQTTVCKVSVDESSSKKDVLSQMLDAAQTEFGLFFLDGAGNPAFHDSEHRSEDPRSTTVQVTLGDGGPPEGELPFVDLTPDFDVARVANEIRATRTAVEGEVEAPVEQVAADGLSQARYYRRTKSFTTLHTSDAAAKTFCHTVLAKLKDAKLEFRQVAFDPAVVPDGFLWRAVIAGELSDRVRIRRRPQQVGDPLERECFIEAITHRCTLDSRIVWLTTWDLSPAS